MPPCIIILFEVVKVAIGSAALFSIWIAYKAYQANLRKQEEDRVRDADKELLSQTQKSLEWAYNGLTNDGNDIPPRPDRINWLTCARHLLRYNKISEKIVGATYKTVHAEVEEYWRHKFYLALSDTSLMSAAYFEDQSRQAWPENIEISSAMVVIDFSNWKESVMDPTDDVDRQKMITTGNCFKGSAGRGLRAYVRNLEELRAAQSTETSAPPANQ